MALAEPSATLAGLGEATVSSLRGLQGHQQITQRTLWACRSWFRSLTPTTKMLAQSPELSLGSGGLALRVARELLATVTCMLLSSDFLVTLNCLTKVDYSRSMS